MLQSGDGWLRKMLFRSIPSPDSFFMTSIQRAKKGKFLLIGAYVI